MLTVVTVMIFAVVTVIAVLMPHAAGTEGPPGPPAKLPNGRVAPPPDRQATVRAAASAIHGTGGGCLPASYGADFYAPAFGSAKTVALTFDDGPGASTAAVIAVLRSYGVTATFFNIGQNAAAQPDMVRQEAAYGYLIGNHTWDHPNMVTLSAAAQATELDRTSAEQEALIGWAPCVFRPPYGNYNATTLTLAQQRKMAAWIWSVDTEDWKAAGSGAAYWVNRIISLAESEGGGQDHPVILMHNQPGGNPATLAALPVIISYFQSRGYTFVNLAGATGTGYRVLTSGGALSTFGAAGYGQAVGDRRAARAVSEATDPDTGGYWVLRSDGSVLAFHAPRYGSLARLPRGVSAVAIAASHGGYLVLTSDGSVTAFGGARWYGSGAGRLGGAGQPRAVGLAADPVTGGYWILTSVGGVWPYHAPWYGSATGKLGSGQRATAITASPQGGYLVLSSSGAVFGYHAATYGAPRRLGRGVTAVGLAIAPATGGYWILLSNGGVLNFHAPWHGSAKGRVPARQVVIAIAST
jgi:peptidoglycan/xylan/chitin deacetylase (PgdA/CDA1 family)